MRTVTQINKQKISKDRRAREAYIIGKFKPFVYYDIKLMARNRVGPGADWQRERVVVSADDSKFYIRIFVYTYLCFCDLTKEDESVIF